MDLPKDLNLTLKKYKVLRYGENPHQQAAFCVDGSKSPGFEKLWGIDLSYNNLDDAYGAWKLVSDFNTPTVAIIKHGNPSGIASRENPLEAFNLAFEADQVSAYGGIVATNVSPTIETIEAMSGKFFELMIAPGYSKEVLTRLEKRSAKMRVIRADLPKDDFEIKRIFKGFLVQTPDTVQGSKSKWKVVSGSRPSAKVYEDLEMAWKVVKHVKSNAIVVVSDLVMVGMGTGQPNRVNSVKLALGQAGKRARGAVLASDAFFPFEDSVDLAAASGISTIIQPGGSINDERVIADAKKHGIVMIFTGVRHFKH